MSKKDNAPTRQTSEVIVPGKETMDRRDFFVTAGKLVIPTLGILGLSLASFPRKVEAADCSNTCATSCAVGCTGGCAGSCSSSCTQSCGGACTGTCSGTATKN